MLERKSSDVFCLCLLPWHIVTNESEMSSRQPVAYNWQSKLYSVTTENGCRKFISLLTASQILIFLGYMTLKNCAQSWEMLKRVEKRRYHDEKQKSVEKCLIMLNGTFHSQQLQDCFLLRNFNVAITFDNLTSTFKTLIVLKNQLIYMYCDHTYLYVLVLCKLM